MQAQEQQEGLNNLIKEYSELFNKYDFKLSREIPENAYKAIKIGGNNNFLNLYNYLYENATVYLDRKKEKADSIKIDAQTI